MDVASNEMQIRADILPITPATLDRLLLSASEALLNH